jgi:hypothetical protein
LNRLQNYTNTPASQKYVTAVVLNYDIDGVLGEYLSEDELAKSQLEFLGMVVNDQAEVEIIAILSFFHPSHPLLLSEHVAFFPFLSPLSFHHSPEPFPVSTTFCIHSTPSFFPLAMPLSAVPLFPLLILVFIFAFLCDSNPIL